MTLEIAAYMIPNLVEATARQLIDEGFECTCPMAEKNGASTVVLCHIERQPIVVRHNPLAVKLWCAGDYAGVSGEKPGPCPTWQDYRDGEEVNDRVQQATQDHENAVATNEQIRAGVRVDDKGLEEQDLVQEYIRQETGASAGVDAEDQLKQGITREEAAEIRSALQKGDL